MPRTPNIPARRFAGFNHQPVQVAEISKLLEIGLEMHRMGNLNDAKAIYERILVRKNNHFDATQLLATVYLQQKQLALSLKYFDKALQLNKKNAIVFNNRGVVLKDLELFDQALRSYEAAVRIKPDYPEALYNIGVVLQELKKPEEALKSYDAALSIKPDYADALNNRGNVLKELNRHGEALESYDAALLFKPHSADIFINRGLTLHQLRKFDQSVKSYDKALHIKPDYVDAFYNRGLALNELKKFEDAIQSFQNAIRLRHDHVEAFNNLGNSFQEIKRFDEAIKIYLEALRIKPKYAEAFNNLGNALQGVKRYDEAIQNYNEALRVKPDYAEAYFYRGMALQKLRRFDDAFKSYESALNIKPNYAQAFNNRGLVLQELRRFDEAIMSFDAAFSIKPDYFEAIWNKSLLFIRTGRFLDGWALYESRLDKEDTKNSYYRFPQLSWRGQEDLQGKTLLIFGEQGFGDVIQFVRYLKFIHEKGINILLEVPQTLVSIISSLKIPITIVAKGDEKPKFDAYCPLMSLPYVFKTTVDSIPAQASYLHSNPVKVKNWHNRLGNSPKKRIGIVWSGSSMHKNDHNRSIELEELSELIKIPYEWHSLQKEYREKDKELLLKHPEIQQHEDDIIDFSDTAALIECMDLIISVDTSVAHLAGALGKPTWILLPYMPDYRWMLDRADCPWYPSVRLFRQDESSEWSVVINAVMTALSNKVILINEDMK